MASSPHFNTCNCNLLYVCSCRHNICSFKRTLYSENAGRHVCSGKISSAVTKLPRDFVAKNAVISDANQHSSFSGLEAAVYVCGGGGWGAGRV